MADSQLPVSGAQTVYSPHEPLVAILKSALTAAHGSLATHRDKEVAVHLPEVYLMLPDRVRTIDQAENPIPLTDISTSA